MSITPLTGSGTTGRPPAVEQRLEGAAADFEALFLKQLLRFAEMDLGQGIAGDTYQDWWHSALSDQMAQRQPLGIAASILGQLDRSTGRDSKLSGQQLNQLVQDVSNRHGLAPELLSAVVQVESGGDPQAVSRAGARGLMQLMPDTARLLGVWDSFDPALNLDGGARYLKSMLERYEGDLDKALGAYNAGPGAVDRHNGVPPYAETQRYVEKVRQVMQEGEIE